MPCGLGGVTNNRLLSTSVHSESVVVRVCVLARLASALWPDGVRFLYASLLARRGPVPESQRESHKIIMVAPGQDPPGRHSNEALLLEALDEFDAVESTPLKLCRPSLQKSQDDIRGSIGDGSRLDIHEEIFSTVSAVSKGVPSHGI